MSTADDDGLMVVCFCAVIFVEVMMLQANVLRICCIPAQT